MRELLGNWVESFVAFARGHGGGGRANSSVGVAFVIGALVVAVLGLRWVSASGPSQEGTDDTPWRFEEAGESGPTTTVPASTPPEVVVVRDPGDPAAGETIVTLPPGQSGVFLPGFPPTAGGTTGTTDAPGVTQPGGSPTTTRPRGTNPTPNPTPTPTTTTTSTTTTSTTTTTTTTTTVPEEPPDAQTGGGLGDVVTGLLGVLGLRIV